MLHKSWAVLSVLLVVGGVRMLLYPLCSGWAAENRQDEVIRTYQIRKGTEAFSQQEKEPLSHRLQASPGPARPSPHPASWVLPPAR